MLISVINKYSKTFSESVRGERVDSKELSGGAKINQIFDV
jgi:hypothetical protein